MNSHPLKTELEYLRTMRNCEPLEVSNKTYAAITDCMLYLLNRFDDAKEVTEDMSCVLDAIEPFLTADDHKNLEHMYDAWDAYTENLFKGVLS